VNGDIRWTGGATPNYTVLELHRFLQDLADDAQAAGNDLVDITSDTPSVRSTDNIITLNSPYNIDDTMAEHLYAGSITQDNGDTVYSGLRPPGSGCGQQLGHAVDGDPGQQPVPVHHDPGFSVLGNAGVWGLQW
jgi:hypothetical protein